MSYKIDVISPDQKYSQKIKDAATLFITHLLPRKRCLDLTIICKDGIDDIYGECYLVSHRHHRYKIYLDISYDEQTVISTLAHECVHLKQFAKKELMLYTSYSIWHGQHYEIDPKNSPWEDEASEMEDILVAIHAKNI